MKNTKQRNEILEMLSNTKSHPNASEVYGEVRKKVKDISLATVYRNLNGMADAGKILRITDANAIEHFDFDTSEHSHFICQSCGRIFDVETIGKVELYDKNFVSRFCDVRFYGLCPDCDMIV